MKKNATRNALVMSIISMLLCVSMLVGTTFAWFTDEVVSGKNTIAAGNLDIEMYHSNAKVTNEEVAAATDLFLDVNGEEILWEPGVVSYENIEIANVGSLALQYRLSLDIFDENTLNGHGLSEVLKVVLLDETIAAGATRAEVMALATAALEDPAYTLDGKLTHLVEQGKLYPADSGEVSSITGALVIFWQPNDNDVDNLYNANNGQITSDTLPLHIEFGVHLEATQLTYEEDSFGPDYDRFTGFEPIAVVDKAENTISASYGIGTAAEEVKLDASYKFRPTESDLEADYSEYLYYIVDFEISADQDVPADSILLAGYYSAWCEAINNGNWFAFANDGTDVAAGEVIRLVDGLGYTVHYKDIVDYGNDGIGFKCGLKDLTGENYGTTVTVKLNLYETTYNPNTGEGDKYTETGKVIEGGIYTYTFDTFNAESAEDLQTALDNGYTKINLAADIDMAGKAINVPDNSELTLDLNGHTLTSMDGGSGNNWALKAGRGATLTLNDSVGGGKVVASCYGVYVQPGSTFTMNGGTISVSGNGAYDMGVVVWNGKFVMNAGTVEGKYAVYASDYWKNAGQDVPNCEIAIADGCVVTGTTSEVDVYEAPTAVVNVPNYIEVYAG